VSLTGLKSFNTNIYEKVLYISYFSTKKKLALNSMKILKSLIVDRKTSPLIKTYRAANI